MIYGNKFIPEYKALQEQVLLKEVYFGKTEQILELEHAVSEMRREAKLKDKNLKTNDKSVVNFCKIVENIFGFDTVGVFLVYSDVINATCLPIGRRFGKKFNIDAIKDNLIVEENNFKYKKSAHYTVLFVVYIGLLTSKDLTDQEVTAILLHEIGHNFSDCFNPNKIEVQGFWPYRFLVLIVDYFMKVWATLKDLVNNSKTLSNLHINIENAKDVNDIIQQAKINISKGSAYISIQFVGTIYSFIIKALTSSEPFINSLTKQSRNGFNILLNGIFHIYGTLMDVYYNLNALLALSPFSSILTGIGTIIKKFANPKLSANTVLGLPFLVKGYKDERLADKFVAVYGYSSELSSALDKMGTITSGIGAQDYLAKNKFLGWYYNLVRLPGEILLQLFDEHPESISRAQANLEYLEKELNNQNISQEIKEVIKENITETKKVIKRMTEVNKKYRDNFIAKKCYYSFLLKVFGGDPRNALIKSKDEMDKLYREKLGK